MFSGEQSLFLEATVLAVDIKRQVCKCKTTSGAMLGDVEWASPIGQARENGDNYSPMIGETVYLTSVSGKAVILFTKKILHFNGTTRASLGQLPKGSDFGSDYNASPLPPSARMGGSAPEEMVPGDRLFTNDRGSIFGLLRSGSFVAKASALSQIFLSKIDNLVRIVARNYEFFGESKVDLSVNSKGKLFSFRGFFKTKEQSLNNTPAIYEAEGNVAAALEARDDYLDKDLSGVVDDSVVAIRSVPLYNVDGDEIGQASREVLLSTGERVLESLNEAQDAYSKVRHFNDEWKVEVVAPDGSSYQYIHPKEIKLFCNGKVTMTFNGDAGTLVAQADTSISLLTETLNAECTNLNVTAETSNINSTTTTVTSPTTNITSTTTHTGNMTVTGVLTIVGGLAASPGVGGGSATFSGMDITMTGATLTSDTDVVASGISLSTHKHPGVTTGGGQTGTPV